MLATLSRPVRRFVAVALLVLAVSAAFGSVVRPLARDWGRMAVAIDDARTLATGYARTVSMKHTFEEQAAELRTEKPDPAWFLPGETDALAAASLQDRVTSIAQAAGAELRSIQIIPATDEDGVRRVGATVEMSTRTSGLLRAAYALESGTPYLFITGTEAVAEVDGTPTDDPTLVVRFDVSGYRLPKQK